MLTRYNVEFRHSMAGDSAVNDGIQLKFLLMQAFIFIHVTGKNEEDLILREGANVLTTFLPWAQGQLTP